MIYDFWVSILYKRNVYACPSVKLNVFHKLKRYYLRLKVDKIWCEDGVVARLMHIN